MLLRLREDISLRMTGDDLELHGKGGIRIKGQAKILGGCLKRLEKGMPIEIQTTNLEKKLLNLLEKKTLLTKISNMENRNAVWEAHYNLKNPLQNKAVLIIGCGGTGAIIADHLARCGLGKIGLIDGAKLDLPDLNRQFTYRKKDLSKPKVALLKKLIESETKTKVIEAHEAYLSEANLNIFTQDYDLVINCADRPKYQIQELAIEVSNQKNCPVLFGSVGICDYVVGPFLKDGQEKMEHAQKIKEELQVFQNSKKVIKGSQALLNTRAAIEIATRAFECLAEMEQLEFAKISV